MSTSESVRRNQAGEQFHPMPTETKASIKTTELFFYLAAVLAVVAASLIVGDRGPQTPDPFNAGQAMQYITFLTIGYMISRGLAKAGSCNHSDA